MVKRSNELHVQDWETQQKFETNSLLPIVNEVRRSDCYVNTITKFLKLLKPDEHKFIAHCLIYKIKVSNDVVRLNFYY